MKKYSAGFTLIELLIVVAIIAILAAVVFVALNPLQRFKDSRDAHRWSDVSELLNAIKLNQVDNGGTYVTALQNAADGFYQIGTAANGCDSCTATSTQSACLDLTGLVTVGHQLGSIPHDPVGGTDVLTYYYLKKSGQIITVGACKAEGSAISVTR